MILFVRKATIYQGFTQYIKAGSIEVSDIKTLNLLSDCEEKLNIKTRVELSRNPLIASPIMIGFFRPEIVLPACELKDKELAYIFVHELIHYRQRDMFYKWLIQIVVCAHWFNPFVYLLEKEVNKSCELSCDEKIIFILDDKARRDYGDTLISFLQSKQSLQKFFSFRNFDRGSRTVKRKVRCYYEFKKKILIFRRYRMDYICRTKPLQSLNKALEKGTILLSHNLQRPEGQWNRKQKTDLIDSLLRKYLKLNNPYKKRLTK